MRIVEFGGGTLRFLDKVPETVPAQGFIWIYLERDALESALPSLQQAAHRLGGSPVLDLHVKDMGNRAHPSSYDYTSVYDLVVFRRLATELEVDAELGESAKLPKEAPLRSFHRVRTRAVAFVVFDRLLISVHPSSCYTAKAFLERYLSDVVQSEAVSSGARSRLPSSAPDLMLRMLNVMVDSYLELRKQLSTELDDWQRELLGPRPKPADWSALMSARNALHTLEDLCEEQNDAMQEWLDTQREQPSPWMQPADRDSLLARARDVVEHVQRVLHHVRRMEQGAETAVQIHFSALGNRTNDIMRTLTALTAIFLPLNLIAGVFGMNFEWLPLTKRPEGFWMTLGSMAAIALLLGIVFWRKHYLARTER